MTDGKFSGDRQLAERHGIVLAPFSPDQVIQLEKYQRGGVFHPFTCGNRGDGNHRENDIDLGLLVPTVRGWICPFCNYTQDWAHEFMVGRRQ